MQKLLPGIRKKLTPIIPFLYHLYQGKEVLMEVKEVDNKVAEDLIKFKEEHNEEEEQSRGDTDTRSTEAEPEVEPLQETAPAKSHSKSRSQRTTSHHAEPSTAQDDTSRNMVSTERGFPDDPFRALRGEIRNVQATYERIESMLKRVCVSMGGC